MRGHAGARRAVAAVSAASEVIVEADGGSRGNPGPAGFGAVVWDADHCEVLAQRREAIGITTNNVAEYRGLIAGLAAASEVSARIVLVRMDSRLVVEQMSGRWQIKKPALAQLARQARELVATFDRVEFTWIPRERNKYADRLANEAMDAAARSQHTPAPKDTAVPPPAPGASEPAATPAADVAMPEARGVERISPGWLGVRGVGTRLLLLRHGQTDLSVQRRYSGRRDVPLTDLGREQADRAAKYLCEMKIIADQPNATAGAPPTNIAAVVTSPLDRARSTAVAVANSLDVPLQVHEDLVETDFGAWEGLTFFEAAQQDPQLHAAWLGDPSVAPPGGESFDTVADRVSAVCRELITGYPGRQLVVVSHVTPIKTLLRQALAVGPALLYRLHLDLASLSVAEFYADGAAAVLGVNNTSYL